MKLTTFILITSLLQVSASTFGQRITINEKKVSVTKLFFEIRKQTGYDILIEDTKFNTNKQVAAKFIGTPLNTVLDRVIEGTDLTYLIQGKTVVLREKDNSILSYLAKLFESDIRGRVLDENGSPLQGATVSIKGSDRTVRTDAKGEFIFSNVPEKASLEVRYVGYKVYIVDLANASQPISIKLELETGKLEEVAVEYSTGYQTLPKERATGSFGVVTGKQLNQFPVTSILERLQGLVPGVNISTKTVAGNSRNGTINIRGISTLVSSYTKVSTEPLLVIDGFPSQQSISNGALDFLNPDDILQITFLKDAAAASIWGIQAANGVIVVNTKRGTKNSKPVFNFATTIGTGSLPRPDYGKMMSMSSYIDLEKELVDKGILQDPVLNTFSFFPENNSQVQAIIFKAKRGEITLAQRDQELAALSLQDNADQMSRLMLQRPTTRQYNLSVSGGGVNNSFFVSGYFYDEERSYRSNVNKGYSFKAGNVSTLANGRITVNSDLTFGNTRDKINGAAVRAMGITAGGLRPYDLLQDANGNTIYYDVVSTPKVARDLENRGYLPFRYSPLDELEYSNTYDTGNNLNLNLSVNGNVNSWLSLNVSGNLGRAFSETELYWEPDSYEARMLVNQGTSFNTSGTKVYGVPVGGRLNLSNGLSKTYSLRGQMNINKTWNEKHQFAFLAGTEIREQFNKTSGETRYGYDKLINAFRSVNPLVNYRDMRGQNRTIGPTSQPVIEKTTRALSYYANGSYTFDNRYTVSGSARFDDYNLLGVDRRKRAIPLWSAGLKWNIKNESWLKELGWLDQLSARTTYGFSGNAPQGYAPVAVISLLGTDFYTNYNYGLIATPAIDNLGWETTRMINYGLDFSLFNSRVSGTVEYYDKRTTDIIWSMPINGTYGFTNSLFNTAKLNGKGVDLGLTVVPLVNDRMRLSTTLNLSYNTNVIKDVRFQTPTNIFSPETLYDGYPRDYIFSYVWAGLDATGQSLIRDPKDGNKTYTINQYPNTDIRAYSGRSESPWFGSFGSTFQYGQWELGVQLQYVFGGVFRKPSLVSIGFSNDTNVGRSGDLDDRWRKPGDEAFTNVPGLVFGPNTNYNASLLRYTESDYLIRSRSNIRLQQITLSYNFSKKLLDKVGVKGFNLSGVCRNLGMLWAANKENLDPDYTYTIGNNYQLAPVTSFSLRASLNF